MPALIAFPQGPISPERVSGIALASSADSLLLLVFGPLPSAVPWVTCDSAAAVERAWEAGRVAVARGTAPGQMPDWLELDDCERVLVILGETEPAKEPVQGSATQRIVAALFAAGCEDLTLLPAGELDKLAQSWTSGRRAGIFLRRPIA